mmetsp:Transcript_35292/g.51863  ORF Transcript_35292/g.51863 Transcript_35292/m.51863 type:complete len:113 (+) Transcript_35292:489-827(+)
MSITGRRAGNLKITPAERYKNIKARIDEYPPRARLHPALQTVPDRITRNDIPCEKVAKTNTKAIPYVNLVPHVLKQRTQVAAMMVNEIRVAVTAKTLAVLNELSTSDHNSLL